MRAKTREEKVGCALSLLCAKAASVGIGGRFESGKRVWVCEHYTHREKRISPSAAHQLPTQRGDAVLRGYLQRFVVMPDYDTYNAARAVLVEAFGDGDADTAAKKH